MGSCLVSTVFSSREVYTERNINNHMVIILRKPFDFILKQERAKLATEKLVKGCSIERIEEDSEEVFCGSPELSCKALLDKTNGGGRRPGSAGLNMDGDLENLDADAVRHH